MRLKMRRLHGCRRRGRGWSSNRSGARGGVGRAGLWDHKITTRILEQKAEKRSVLNIRDLEARIQRYKRKGLILESESSYRMVCGAFCKRYRKILGVGQPSKPYDACTHVHLSDRARKKTRPE